MLQSVLREVQIREQAYAIQHRNGWLKDLSMPAAVQSGLAWRCHVMC